VYTLGVVLYELLTGHLPQNLRDLMVHEAVRAIRDDDPTPAGSVDRSLRGDVETILSKALEKDKTRRYQSAGELAEDIRRSLRQQPIAARPASVLYRMGKFTKRNKAIVAGVSIAFMASLLTAALAVRQAITAERARQVEQHLRADAESARDEAEAAGNFLAEMLGAADPEVMGWDVRVVDVLGHATGVIDERFPDRPSVRSRLHRNIGITYRRLGLLDKAETQLLAARRDAALAYDDDHPAMLQALRSLAVLYDRQHRFDESLPMHQQILAIQRRTLGPEHRDTLGSACNVGLTLYDLARYDEAARVLEPTLNAMRETLGVADRFTINAIHGIGAVRLAQGQFDDAQPAFEEALHAAATAFGPNDARVISALISLAEVNLARNQPEHALTQVDDALQRARTTLLPEHWRIGELFHLRGVCLLELQRLTDAESALRNALTIYVATFGEDGDRTRKVTADLARLEGLRAERD